MSNRREWRISPLLSAYAIAPALFIAAAGAWGSTFSLTGLAVAVCVGAVVYALIIWIRSLRGQLRATRSELGATRANEQLLKGTIERAPEIIWRGDAAGERSFISGAWERWTGQSSESAIGLGWFECVHCEDQQRCLSAYRVASLNQSAGRIEYRINRSDDSETWVLDRFEPCLDADGAFMGFIGVSTDITQRKREEADRRLQIDDLLRASDEMTNQLGEMTDRLAEALGECEQLRTGDQVKSQYLAAIAHDYQSPIDEIKNVLALVNSPDLPEPLRPFIRRGLDAHARLESLVERAIELSGDDSEDDVSVTECDLWELTKSAVKHFEPLAMERGVEVVPDIEGSVPVRVLTDPVRLVRILRDLINAAVTIVDRGSVVLRVERERTQGDQWFMTFVITLTDHTVPAEMLERAFYPRESVGGEPGGLGLGPALRLAQQLGGRIGAERDEDGKCMIWHSLALTALDPNADGRRSTARLMQECVRSNLGVVLDLSMGGMRLMCRKVPNDIVQVHVSDEEETITLTAQVVWTHRVGFRKYEVGLTYIDVAPEQVAELGRFASRNRIRRTMNAA